MGLEKVVTSNTPSWYAIINQTTIADKLKRGGYATHCVGKWDTQMGVHSNIYTGDLIPSMATTMLLRTTSTTCSAGGYVDLKNNSRPVTYENGTNITFLSLKLLNRLLLNTIVIRDLLYLCCLSIPSYACSIGSRSKCYIDDPACQSIPYENQCVYCGMLRAADEGIANITVRRAC